MESEGIFEPPRGIAVERSLQSRTAALEVLLLATVLPGIIAAADTAMLNECRLAFWKGWSVFASYALFVVQTALLSTLLGWRLRYPLLKWLVFVWALLLVDLLVFTVGISSSSWGSCLAYAFLSGQVGVLILWGILGTWFWPLRYPGAVFGLAVITVFSAQMENAFWFPILSWQCVATAVFITIVWFFGFRLRRISADGQGIDYRRMQFSVRHLFIWTTVVACVVGVARVVDWTSLFYFSRAPLFPIVAIGGCFTLLSMIGIWSALGAESFLVRFLVLLVCAPLIALAVGAVGLSVKGTSWQSSWIADNLRIGASFDIALWLTWMYLASLFLGSTLLMFRASGYRLVRDRR